MRLPIAVIAAIGALAVAAPTAHAAPISCDYDYMQPFTAWGDTRDYGLAPSGSFEGGAEGWDLSGDASVVAPGNALRSAESGLFALSLPPGSSAISPPVCVKAGSPWARMFAYTPVLNPEARRSLRVEVIFAKENSDHVSVRKVRTLSQSRDWEPTGRMALGGPLTVRPGANWQRTVRYRFTPLHGAGWVIDDLFIDPKRR